MFNLAEDATELARNILRVRSAKRMSAIKQMSATVGGQAGIQVENRGIRVVRTPRHIFPSLYSALSISSVSSIRRPDGKPLTLLAPVAEKPAVLSGAARLSADGLMMGAPGRH